MSTTTKSPKRGRHKKPLKEQNLRELFRSLLNAYYVLEERKYFQRQIEEFICGMIDFYDIDPAARRYFRRKADDSKGRLDRARRRYREILTKLAVSESDVKLQKQAASAEDSCLTAARNKFYFGPDMSEDDKGKIRQVICLIGTETQLTDIFKEIQARLVPAGIDFRRPAKLVDGKPFHDLYGPLTKDEVLRWLTEDFFVPADPYTGTVMCEKSVRPTDAEVRVYYGDRMAGYGDKNIRFSVFHRRALEEVINYGLSREQRRMMPFSALVVAAYCQSEVWRCENRINLINSGSYSGRYTLEELQERAGRFERLAQQVWQERSKSISKLPKKNQPAISN